MDSLPWWKTAHLYHVYPSSFLDANGDGIGDFKGITQKAQYFKDIGVDVIWMSPIFKSPMQDLGYDIADYRVVDPIFGNNDDLIELIKTFKELGIKILLDLVPNHTSDQHIWFQKSIKKEDPYTDYYIWVDGKTDPETGKRIPPNNWVSNFSGGAWEWNERRQQYYFHQFLIQQPDLNYRNPRVVKEMDEIMVFWLDNGVDGFRIDAIPFMFEDKELRDNPVTDGVVGDFYTQNRPETYELVNHWSEKMFEYSQKHGVQIGLWLEAYASPENTFKYCGKGKYNFTQPFCFGLLNKIDKNSRPVDYKNEIMSCLDNFPAEGVPSWVIGNHDNPRAATRYEEQLLDGINILTGVLPGNKVTYYGEEICMTDTYVRWDQTVDPAGKLLGPDKYTEASRDPERTPMQWDDTENAGFSNASKTWLPVNPNYWQLNVADQWKAKTSHLKVFQAMTAARQDPVLLLGDCKVVVYETNSLVVIRSYNGEFFVLIINMDSVLVTYTSAGFFAQNGLDSDVTVVTSSLNVDIKSGLTIKQGEANIQLRPKGAILLRSKGGKSCC